MLRTFIYKVILFILPIIFMLVVFIVTDPFLIIHQYNDYTKTYHLVINKDFISGETYINKRKKYRYNSFVFGNSRTLAYPIKSWQKYLDKNAVPFKFDASSETIFGIHSKIKYIDAQKDTIQNALLIFCQGNTFLTTEDSDDVPFMKHPKISQTSNLNFYSKFIRIFFDPKLLFYFIMQPFTDKYNYFYPDNFGIKLDTINNDCVMQLWEKELKDGEKSYYEYRKKIFYQRSPLNNYNKAEIAAKQIAMLKEMKQLFDKHKTKYKIVISPLYNQIYFNKTDMKFLQAIFGAKNIYDYSGINNYTNKMKNYYENSHYRSNVGDSIMSEIYK